MFSPFVVLIACKVSPTRLLPEQTVNGHRKAKTCRLTPGYPGTNEQGFERDRVD